MYLTEANKKHIDSLSYEELLHDWRFAAIGDPRFQGATGEYWGKRMAELRDRGDVNPVEISKKIGWERK